MKKFAQIVDNKAYWIFEAEELPPYPNPEDFLDITGRDDIQEGYLYNPETGEFKAPDPIEFPVDPFPPVVVPPAGELVKKIDELRTQLTGSNLNLFESIVENYEKTAADNLATLESTTAIFEEVQTLKGEIATMKTLIESLVTNKTE